MQFDTAILLQLRFQHLPPHSEQGTALHFYRRTCLPGHVNSATAGGKLRGVAVNVPVWQQRLQAATMCSETLHKS